MFGCRGLICASMVFLSCTTQTPITKDESLPKKTSVLPKKPAAEVMEKASIPKEKPKQDSLVSICRQQLDALPEPKPSERIQDICKLVEHKGSCRSVENTPIFHFDSASERIDQRFAKRVLVLAVVHGDEPESGSVALRWMERLLDIESRNTWRIVPILNPDGMKQSTRTNANGVDLNRNFPSEDWSELALKWWKEKGKSNPRRYPGARPASEPETLCAMEHIDDFKPDFIVAVHTPYGVLDFDGPKIQFPSFSNLPWVSLGTFPGSLGRYMWKDQKVPVMTVELRDGKILSEIDKLDTLQDIAGTVAIRSTRQ